VSNPSPGPSPTAAHLLPVLPRLLRVCRTGCCRTTLVCGATGTSCGSSFLPNRRSSPEPDAAPLAAVDEPLASALGACVFTVAELEVPSLAAAGLAEFAGLAAGLAAAPVLATVPVLAAVPVLAVPPAVAVPDLAAVPDVLFLAAPEFPDAACVADAPTVALPTTGRERNRKCCCPSVQRLVVTQ